MKVTFITTSLSYGGAAKMLAFVSNNLCKRGHDISIINLLETDTLVVQPIDSRIKVYEAQKGSNPLSKRISQVHAVFTLLRRIHPDVVIGFTLFPNFFAALAGRMLHIPSVISERGDPKRTIGTSPGLKEKVLLNTICKANGAVFQTEGAADFYPEQIRKAGKTIPNPIDLPTGMKLSEISERKKTVVSVGRFDNHQKRYDVMLMAFSIFHKEHPDYTLRLFGSGPYEETMKKTCEKLSISSCVSFNGVTRKAMMDIMEDGMFVITSDYEGIPNSLLEAMAVGLPVISTDCTPGGAKLLIRNMENGILVNRDDAYAVADAMCFYADNPEIASQFGSEAKKVLIEYAPNKIIDDWENYLTKIIKSYE